MRISKADSVVAGHETETHTTVGGKDPSLDSI